MGKLVDKNTWAITVLVSLPMLVRSVLIWDGGNGAAKLGAVLPGYLIFPAVAALAVWLTGKFQSKILIDVWGVAALRKVIQLTVALMIYVEGFVVTVELWDNNRQRSLILLLGVGVFMMALGALMPKLPRNRIAGARFSWTLDDAEAWKNSNAVGGVYTFLLGAFITVSALIPQKRESVFTSAEIWAVIIYVAALTLHSRLIALKLRPPRE